MVIQRFLKHSKSDLLISITVFFFNFQCPQNLLKENVNGFLYMQNHLNRTPKLLYSEHLFISLIKSKVIYIEHYSVKTYSSSFASSIYSFL